MEFHIQGTYDKNQPSHSLCICNTLEDASILFFFYYFFDSHIDQSIVILHVVMQNLMQKMFIIRNNTHSVCLHKAH